MVDVPEKAMGRKSISTSLGEILEIGSDDTPRYFNHKLRSESTLKYRIPEHQRYPQWKDEQRQRLVDTVFRDYPMSGVVVSSHFDDSGIYFDFEDGQTRMSILQDFYMDRYPYFLENGDAVLFSGLSRSSQRRFENYKIIIEELYDASAYHISEVFDRLQNGKPLSDKDLYWNRKTEFPYITKAMNLIKEEYWLSTYMNTEKGITDKCRTRLPDVVTLIYAIINFGKIDTKKAFWKCYRAQVNELKNEVTASDEARIKRFLTYLNSIISEVYSAMPARTCKPKENVKTWGNLAKQTGMILFEWLKFEAEPESVHNKNKEKWVQIMLIDRKSGDFMFKGNKTMWNGLKTSHKQNTDDDSLAERLKRVNDFYENPAEISSKNGISYNDGVYGDEDEDDSQEEY